MSLADIVKESLTYINNSITCVEKAEDSITSLVLWSRHIHDVLNLGLATHRSIIMQGILRRIPESMRPAFMGSIMGIRKDLLPFAYLDDECINTISLAIMSSIGIAFRLLRAIGTNRFSVGIVRITSILSRAKTDKGMYLAKETIIALLHELRDNVMSASMLLGEIE